MESIGEEVGQETALGVLDAGNVGDQAQRAAVADAADDGIDAGFLKFRHERLTADPMVAQEHHGFLAVFVDDVGHFFHQTGHLTALECLKVLVLLAGYAVLVIVVALVDDELRAELVADFFLELLQNVGADGSRVAVPVNVLFTAQFIKDEREQVEKRRETNNIYIRMAFEVLPQTAHRVGVGLGLAHVERDLVFDILPVVDDGVVHVHGVPN